jgi:predicted oxidoreductase
MTPLAWSPLGGGMFGDAGTVPENAPRRAGLLRLVETVAKAAKRYGVSPGVMTLAWLMKHPSGILPIVGTIQPDRIREMTRADAIDISREDWYRIFVAARMEPLP